MNIRVPGGGKLLRRFRLSDTLQVSYFVQQNLLFQWLVNSVFIWLGWCSHQPDSWLIRHFNEYSAQRIFWSISDIWGEEMQRVRNERIIDVFSQAAGLYPNAALEIKCLWFWFIIFILFNLDSCDSFSSCSGEMERFQNEQK